jgi:Zn-dependent protease with chaperone function
MRFFFFFHIFIRRPSPSFFQPLFTFFFFPIFCKRSELNLRALPVKLHSLVHRVFTCVNTLYWRVSVGVTGKEASLIITIFFLVICTFCLVCLLKIIAGKYVRTLRTFNMNVSLLAVLYFVAVRCLSLLNKLLRNL